MNQDLICKLCNYVSKDFKGLSVHLNKTHKYSKNDHENYYNLYLKKDSQDGKCKYCHQLKCRFLNLNKGYNDICSSLRCSSLKIQDTKLKRYGDPFYTNRDKYEKTCIERYGVTSTASIPERMEKAKQTQLEKYGKECYLSTDECKENRKLLYLDRYGVEYISQSGYWHDKIKETSLEKYGVDHWLMLDSNLEKRIETNLERYGCEYGLQNKEVKDKGRVTCFNNYGVDHFTKTNEFLDKARQTNLNKYGIYALGGIRNCYSKISQELFNSIFSNLNEEQNKNCYYATLNKEYFIKCRGNYYLIDFCIPTKKLIIEFYGDYWHRNPDIYEYNFKNLSIWLKNEERINQIKDEGYHILIIWEKDYNSDKEKIIQQCLDFINYS